MKRRSRITARIYIRRVEKAIETLKDRLVIRKEIYLITDGQANGWRELGEMQRVLERYKTQIKVHMILVGSMRIRTLA